MKTFNLTIRIIVLPLWFAIHLIKSLATTFYNTMCFIKYGGEIMVYTKDEKIKIHDVWTLLKDQFEDEIKD